MTFFTREEFNKDYPDYTSANIPTWYIKASCEMIFSQIGLRYRDTSWDSTSVPLPIKEASMEQLRFMLDQDLPMIDSKNISAGSMKADLMSDYSTLALRILANNGYLYRGNPLNENMSITIGFGCSS